MKIIDAHLHINPQNPYFEEIALKAGHQNTVEHLIGEFERLQIVGAVVMGHSSTVTDIDAYPAAFSFCAGFDIQSALITGLKNAYASLEKQLMNPRCVGIKLYPGYDPYELTDSRFSSVYEMAAHYRLPVAIHTGVTARRNALLKYSHPLKLDELAVLHPQIQFVMCHFGNPWLMDAAAVLMKNENVAADISGLLEGNMDLDSLYKKQKGYLDQLSAWIAYAGCFDRILFGTDWPLANLTEYIQFTEHMIPQEHLEDVFFHKANRIYGLQL